MAVSSFIHLCVEKNTFNRKNYSIMNKNKISISTLILAQQYQAAEHLLRVFTKP